jgi:hypothetical protein
MKHPPREPMTLGIFVIAKFCFIVLLSSVGFAQTTQARYDGQERCGREHPTYSKPITVNKSCSIKKERYFSTIETITMPHSTNASSWK